MKNWHKFSVSGLLVFLALSCGQAGNKNKKPVYSQDFKSAKAIHDFLFFEPNLWQITTDSRNNTRLVMFILS